MDIHESIKNSFIEVFSDIGFIDIEESNVFEIAQITHPISYKIPILLPFCGDLIVILSSEIAYRYVENVLCINQKSITDDDLNDSMSEFLNVVVGKIFQYHSPDALFEIGFPKRIDVSTEESYKAYSHQFFITPEEERICVVHKIKE